MKSPCLREVSKVCHHGCCPSPFSNLPPTRSSISKPRNSSATCRHSFAATTASSFFPNTQFTNHECLPSLEDSFIGFNKSYPQYFETEHVDQIRAKEYFHLPISKHICLDYIGIGLFSHSQLHNLHSSSPSNASSSFSTAKPVPSPQNLGIPLFSISYKSVNLKTQLLHGGRESAFESAIKKRIMDFLHISEDDYSMVFTANRTGAFKLLAEAYPFQSSKKLLTVYDYESEAVEAMINSSEKRGARVMSAEFKWPRLKIHSAKLKKMLVGKRKKKKKRGLFVFPLQSKMSGARYPYLWMSIAQENGWHVLLDACALGPKELDSFGLSLIRPDFLICSFYKVFGEIPSGFGCLFVKKTTIPLLEASASGGIVSLVQAKMFGLPDEFSGTDSELEQASKFGTHEVELAKSSSFSGPISIHATQSGGSEQEDSPDLQKRKANAKQKGLVTSEIVELENPVDFTQHGSTKVSGKENLEVECRGLDHVDSLGQIMISSRARYLINWLVNALMKLRHPNTETGISLIRIYGPKIKFNRAPALAFNVFDWNGEKVEPILVQKLADRNNISLSYGFLHQLTFSDKYQEEKERVLERRAGEALGMVGKKGKDKVKVGITVVTAAFGFLANFEDTYRLWAFVAQFLDADFVEKERWRYTALNQMTIEI